MIHLHLHLMIHYIWWYICTWILTKKCVESINWWRNSCFESWWVRQLVRTSKPPFDENWIDRSQIKVSSWLCHHDDAYIVWSSCSNRYLGLWSQHYLSSWFDISLYYFNSLFLLQFSFSFCILELFREIDLFSFHIYYHLYDLSSFYLSIFLDFSAYSWVNV